jgi:hypothetical protein
MDNFNSSYIFLKIYYISFQDPVLSSASTTLLLLTGENYKVQAGAKLRLHNINTKLNIIGKLVQGMKESTATNGQYGNLVKSSIPF